MAIFALQSPAGGFLDEDLEKFNKYFDDWCVQFDSFDDAQIIVNTLEDPRSVDIVEITPLSYPKYFFYKLQGEIHSTRAIKNKIICIVEPSMGAAYRIAICDINTKNIIFTATKYKSAVAVEGVFNHFELKD